MIWNPGDDSDLMEGGDGVDTAEVNGGNGAEVFTITANGTRVRFDRVDPAPFALDIGTTERLVLNANGGDDRISATGNLAALIALTIDGGAGNDSISGSNGADVLLGGDGADFVDGQQGNDIVRLGAGDDVFQWDPGDGSDVVGGGDGTDTVVFNGSNVGERIDLSAQGAHLRLTRDVGAIAMKIDEVERVQLTLLGGGDRLVVNNLAATDVAEVAVALAGTIGGTAGDGAADSLVVRGGGGADGVTISGGGSALAVTGLRARVTASSVEGANDALVVTGEGGGDRLDASTLAAGVVKLTLDGGSGADTLIGSAGADVLIGGDGADLVDGQQGNDLAFLGIGNDTFQWDPGDGSDIVEGQDGTDTLVFNGSNIGEAVTLSANGARLVLARDVGAVAMDLNGVERIDHHARGGADQIVVGDLAGTGVTQVGLDLAGPLGGGDAQADQVVVNGSALADLVAVTAADGAISVKGLAARTVVTGAEAGDRLVLNGLGGDDRIDASKLAAGMVTVQLNGGLGADLLLGSAGGDLFAGGDGNDVAFMGAGDDAFAWNPGDDNDVVEGQAGFDTLLFNGSNVSENVSIVANGGRAMLVRDVAAVTMDMNDVESIDFSAFGGSDVVTVGDLSGTDVVRVTVDLGALGGGDALADTVIVNGTAGDDVILVTMSGSTLTVLGLAAQLQIENFEGGLDRLVINALAGDDVVDASALLAPFGIAANGGDGDDVLLGGAGNDTLIGGLGEDVALGGLGIDVLDAEIAIQSAPVSLWGDMLL